MLLQNNFNHIVKASGGYVFCLKSGILFFDGLIHISSDGFICLHIGDTNLRWMASCTMVGNVKFCPKIVSQFSSYRLLLMRLTQIFNI